MSREKSAVKDLDQLNEFIYKDTSHGQRWYYGIDKDTNKKTRLSEAEYLSGQGYELGGQPAVWETSETAQPIKVIGEVGERDGIAYFKVEGSKTGIPASEIEWPSETDSETEVESPEAELESMSEAATPAQPGESEKLSDIPEDISPEEQLIRVHDRLVTIAYELNSARSVIEGLWSQLEEKDAKIARLQGLLDEADTSRQPEEVENEPDTDVDVDIEQDVEGEAQLAENTSFSDRIRYWRDRLGLGAARIMTRTRFEDGQVVEQTEEHRGRRWPFAAAGVIIGAGAVWLAMRGNNSGLDALQTDVDQLQVDMDNLPTEIGQDFEGDLSELNERLDAIEDRFDEFEADTSQSPETPTETPSDGLVISNHGPNENPALYDGLNVQVINAEKGQSNFAAVLPEGWTIDNVEGHQVMYNESGINVLEVGQQVKINGKAEALESFMDQQGNISRQGREALRQLGYDLTQGQYEFKRPDGSSGLHFMTVVRTR